MVGDVPDTVGGHGDDVRVVDPLIERCLDGALDPPAVLCHVLPVVERGLAGLVHQRGLRTDRIAVDLRKAAPLAALLRRVLRLEPLAGISRSVRVFIPQDLAARITLRQSTGIGSSAGSVHRSISAGDERESTTQVGP